MVYKLLASLAQCTVLMLMLDGHLAAQSQDNLTAILLGVDHSNVSEDVSVRIPVLRNDRFPEAPIDTLSLQVATGGGPKHGVAHIDIDHGMMIYEPLANYYGLDSFVYKVCSKQGNCATASVSVQVHPVNDGPQAQADIFRTREEQVVILDPLANDRDEDQGMISETHSLHLVSEPHHGEVLPNDWNSLLYQPDEDYYGGDFFYYSICEGVSCDTAMIRLEVIPVNDSPTINEDTVVTFVNLLAVIDVLGNDHDDPDHGTIDPHSLQLGHPSHGEAFLDTTSFLIIYVPDPDFVGVDSFLYRVCDEGPGEPSCGEAMVTIKVRDKHSGAIRNSRLQSIMVSEAEFSTASKSFSDRRSAVNRQ